jgi:hypothetical protein
MIYGYGYKYFAIPGRIIPDNIPVSEVQDGNLYQGGYIFSKGLFLDCGCLFGGEVLSYRWQ